MIQTAEGALNETHSILQRMRELSVQSANDTNTSSDRGELQKEMDQLTKEIDRISQTTQFNTKNLLDGSMGDGVATATNNVSSNLSLAAAATATTTLVGLNDKNSNTLGIAATDTIEVSYVKNGTTTITSLTAFATTTVADVATLLGADGTASYSTTAGVQVTAGGAGYAGAVNGLTITVKDTNGVVRAGATNALSSFTQTTAAQNQRTDGQATFQIGANTNQNIQLSIENVSSSALGVKDIKIGNQGQANVAIKVIDSATQLVSTERSKLGAVQNRLEHTINNLGTASENLTAAESRVRDVDMAKEMMQQTKNNILAQAAQAMLAQANQQPQGVLQLLR